MKTAFFLPAILIFFVSCSESALPQQQTAASDSTTGYVEAERIPPADLNALQAQDTSRYQPYRGGTIRVSGKALEVRDAGGVVVATNGSIIRLRDEDGNCPSEGFSRIVVKGDYFTLEQQTCGGMSFVDEYITFKADADGGIYLHKFGTVMTDRSDPERDIPARTLSVADFGRLRLEDVRIDALYGLFKTEAATEMAVPAAGLDTLPTR